MKITWKEKPSDPSHPIMHGDSPLAREFNERQKKLFKEAEGREIEVNFEQVSTVFLEILADDYNQRHAKKNKKESSGGD